jgi:hypothetical protein
MWLPINSEVIIMRFKKAVVIITFLLFMSLDVFSQTLTSGFPKLMYVTSREGVRERDESSLKGNILRTLLYGEAVQVFFRQANPVTIDDITDYWYSTTSSTVNLRQWIFGGYLSDELPNDLPVIIGRWDDINNERQYYSFHPNHNYAEGYKETGMGLFGTWRINGNIITIHLEQAGEEDVLNETHNIRLNTIDRNNIVLIFPNNETVKLRRNRSGQ